MLEQMAEEEGPVIEEELAPVVEAIEADAEVLAQEVEAEGKAILDKIEEALGDGGVDEVTAECEEASESALADSEFNGIEADRVLPGTNDKVAVIGRSMGKAVEPYAKGLQEAGYDVETFSGDKISPSAQAEWENLKAVYAPDPIPESVVPETQMFQENQAWAQKLADQGYTVVDVDNPGGQAASPFYEMEKETLFGDAAGGAR